MPHEIVNLSLPIITNKVEEALDNSKMESSQELSSASLLQERLVAYVLRRMPTFYTTIEISNACLANNPVNCFSQEQQNTIDGLIQEGLQHLMACQSHQESLIQGTVQVPSASNWFG